MKVAVVGAGILGRLITINLLEKGCRPTLFEKGNPLPDREESASLTAAGMLAPFCELEHGTKEIAKWGMRSLELWPNLIKKLGGKIYFQNEGSLVLSHAQDLNEFFYLQREVDKNGFSSRYEKVDQKRIAELEPHIAPRFNQGLFFSSEAQIAPDDIFKAFNQNILPHIKAHFNTKAFIDGFKVNGEEFDTIFDCRGFEAKKDLINLRGVRGEVIRLQCQKQFLQRPVRIMHPRFPIYLVPRPGHQIIIGASSLESEEAGHVSVRSQLELLSAAYSAIPEIGEARILEQNAQVRPAFADHHPQIKMEGRCIRVNGLYRHGYLLSPAFAELAIQKIFSKEAECMSL